MRLPQAAINFVELVINKMRYRRKVRNQVREELVCHFEDELSGCENDEQKEQKAKELIKEFGDAKLLGKLLRRAKKRCRPLWQKVAVRSAQVIFILIAFIILRGSFLFVGEPDIETNYLLWLNNLVRQSDNESLNARPDVEKAIEKMVEPQSDGVGKFIRTWPGDLNDAELQMCREFLKKNQDAFILLREAMEKPYFWNDYSYDNKDLRTSENSKVPGSTNVVVPGQQLEADILQIRMPDLSKYRTLTYNFNLQILYRAYEGDIEAAVDDCIILNKFGILLQGNGLLIEQLVGIAIEALGSHSVYTILQKKEIPAKDLLKLKSELQRLYSRHKSFVDIEAEKAFWLDRIQREFTDDGRVLREGLPWVVSDWKGFTYGFLFGFPGREAVLRDIELLVDRFRVLTQRSPHSIHSESRKEIFGDIKQSIFLDILKPGFERMLEIVWRLKTERAVVITVLGVLLYQEQEGVLPEELSDLVSEGYFKDLPMDPWSGEPLVYRRTDDGFILYSVGKNFTDDDGEVVQNEEGDIQKYADEGDWVFWPVNK